MIKNQTFSDQRFSQQQLSGEEFHDCRFLRCRFDSTNLSDIAFVNCIFYDDETQSGCSFQHAQLKDASFKHCDLTMADFKMRKRWVWRSVNAKPPAQISAAPAL